MERSSGRLIRRRFACALAVVAALVPSPAGARDDRLSLHPQFSFGAHTYSSWKANEGLPDSSGTANQALYFQKMVPTEYPSAALAFVRGLTGKPASSLMGAASGLDWERRLDGQCLQGRAENGARFVPAWQLSLRRADTGTFYRVVLDCFEAAHPVTSPGWIHDTHPGPAIAAQIVAAGGNPEEDTIVNLVIGFDRGTDSGSPYVFLDNIKVNTTTWTSASGNGGSS